MLPRVNIDFIISRGDSRFCGNAFKPSQREIPESTESMQGNPRKQFVFLRYESVVGLNSLLMKFFYMSRGLIRGEIGGHANKAA